MIELIVLTAVVTFAATPLVRQRMVQRGLLDIPNHRSSHSIPIPRGGGVACALGVATAASVVSLTGHDVAWRAIAASLALAVVGFVDDHFHLGAMPRLGSQAIVGAVLGASLGGPEWVILGALVVLVVVNVVNFMDGINGITGLTMVLWGATAMFAGPKSAAAGVAVVGALAAGSALGFLPWNAVRPRIFLGDAGSYLFGGLAAMGILLGTAGGASPVLLAAPLAVYLADAGLTLLKRILRGAPLFQAHREHIYQRLVHELGLSHLASALWTFAVAAFIALAWGLVTVWVAMAISVAALGAYVGSLRVFSTAQSALARSPRETPAVVPMPQEGYEL